MIIHIRDALDCVQEVNIPLMMVSLDSQELNNFMNTFQTSSTSLTKNPLVRLLYSGNQNVIGQVLTSLSQEFNQMNNENINTAISSKFSWISFSNSNSLFPDGIPSTSISIHSLGSQRSIQVNTHSLKISVDEFPFLI